MDEYIEREAAIAAIMSEPPDAHYPHWYADKIKAIPAADVAPVRHGRWIKHDDGVFTCSECRNAESIESYFCGYCGTKMDLEG